MELFQNILVGVELVQREEVVSPGSLKALEQALWIARHQGSRITLLHSTWQSEVPESIARGAVLVHEGIPETGRQALQDLVERCTTAGVGCELVIVPERPPVAIIRAVMRDGIDLVLVGKRNQADGDIRKVGTVTMDVKNAVREAKAQSVPKDVIQRAINKSLEYTQAHPDEVRKIVLTYTKIPKAAAEHMTLPQWQSDLNRSTIEETSTLAKKYGYLKEEPNLDDPIKQD